MAEGLGFNFQYWCGTFYILKMILASLNFDWEKDYTLFLRV